MVVIRIGFEKYMHDELGFQNGFSYFDSFLRKYVHVLVRHGEPLVIISSLSVLPLEDFKIAIARLDYPTLPFLRMLRILENQQEIFIERILRDRSVNTYIRDILGLLHFALHSRGVVVDLDHEDYLDLAKHLKEIKEAIKKAAEPAPCLGNGLYIDIAERAYQLLKASLGLIMMQKH